MQRRSMLSAMLLVAALVACTALTPTSTPVPTATALPTAMRTAAPPTATAQPNAYPLSQPGDYDLGYRTLTVTDPGRANRSFGVFVWYPAVRPQNATGSSPVRNADPDRRGAPYPVLLGSAKVGNIFAPYLVSHGFVWVGIDEEPGMSDWGPWLVDYPLDILLALRQMASSPPEELRGVLKADCAGALGYSFDGYNALALSGARVDPESYLSQCQKVPAMSPAPAEWWIKYICNMTQQWDEFVTHAGTAVTRSDDGLWQAMTDKRIRAVMPMAPEGAWLFGERGLAAVNRPTLIVGATADDINYYDLEAAYIFEHLGTPDKAMISFVGRSHMMPYYPEEVARLAHFAVAFFGYHLQGRADYAKYFSEEFVTQHDDLAWGVYAAQ